MPVRLSPRASVVWWLSLMTLPVQPLLLQAQTPRVTSAVLWPRHKTLQFGADTAYRTLNVRIVGVPEERLRQVGRDGVVIADAQNRTYIPEAFAVDRPDWTQGEVIGQTTGWIYRVPSGHTVFELRLPGVKPVRFTAKDAVLPSAPLAR